MAERTRTRTFHDDLADMVGELIAAGLHVVPIRPCDPDDPKNAKAPAMPAGYIKAPLQETDEKTLAKVRATSVDGIAVVTNTRSLHKHKGVSYLLTALELEGRAMTPEFDAEWKEAAEHVNAGDTLRRLDRGWVEDTAGGGRRWFFRVPVPVETPADPDDTAECAEAAKRNEMAATEILRLVPRIAAVRHDGTYAELLVTKHQTIVAPSGGRTHPNGTEWKRVGSGEPAILSVPELYLLAGLLAEVDEVGGSRADLAPSPLDLASGRVRQVATDFHRGATTEATVEILCANGFRLAAVDKHGASVLDLVTNPGHGEVRVGGTLLPPGGVFTFSTSAGPIPPERFVSAFEIRAIFDAKAQGDLEALADEMLRKGEARLNPWGLMARRRPQVFPDETQTDHLVMRINRSLADARNPKDESLPFVLAQTTDDGSLMALVSLDREGGLRRWSPRDARTLLLSVVQPARTTKSAVKMLHTLDTAVVDSVLPDGVIPSGVATVRFAATQPVLLPTGAALSKPGLYRQHSALVTIPMRDRNFWSAYRVPEKPTAADAQRACDFIVNEVLSDFPFETTGDKARALLLLLTAATRDLYGAAPGFALDAADRGTGKSLLAKLARVIGIGSAAAQSVSPIRAEDAETAKAIVAAVLDGISALHIDELARGQHITSRVLSELLTSDGAMTLRVLGSSRSIGIPGLLFTACGNNMELGADMQRRFFPIRMVHAGSELAFERSGFRHADLPAWVRQNRPRLLAALHTMASYGIQQTPVGLPAVGSFEAWSRVVLAAMHLVTLRDETGADRMGSDLVMDGRAEFIDSQDAEGDEWLPFMQAWEKQFGTETLVGARTAFGALGDGAIDLPSSLLLQPGQTSVGAAKSWGRALLQRRATAVRSDDAIYRLRCIPDPKNGHKYVLDVSRKATVTPINQAVRVTEAAPQAGSFDPSDGMDLDIAAK